MVKIKSYWVLFFCIITCSAFSQRLKTWCINKGHVTTFFEIGKEYKNRKVLKSIKKDEVLISFKEKFKDSVLTYVNDELYSSDFITSDSISLGISNTAFKINMGKASRKEITFYLPQKNFFIKFTINRKFRLIKVFKFSEEWSLVFTNYVPVYY